MYGGYWGMRTLVTVHGLKAAVVAFAVAAVCFTFVAVDRWWPCAVSGVESEACGLRQDDSFDVGVALGGPHAVQFVALVVGYVLLGVALVLAARRPLWGLLAAALPLLTAASFTDVPLGEASGPLLIALTLTSGFFAWLSLGPARRAGWAAGYTAAIVATLLFVDFFVFAPMFSLGYTSWDTNPWTWLSTAIGCAIAAFAAPRAVGGGGASSGTAESRPADELIDSAS